MRQRELPEIKSSMNNIEAIESFILDLLALKICESEEDLLNALNMSMYDNSSESQVDFIRKAVKSLVSKRLLKVCVVEIMFFCYKLDDLKKIATKICFFRTN
jgi:protein tyrosine phosphatase